MPAGSARPTLRRPVPHRLAWFSEFKGTAARYRYSGNLSQWIRSAAYLSLEQSRFAEFVMSAQPSEMNFLW